MLSLIILTFCLITVPQTQLSGVDNIDKIVHFIFFFGLALIVWWESAERKQRIKELKTQKQKEAITRRNRRDIRGT